MKRRICASLLTLCSLIGEAERKSDASVIGKTLKYSSASLGATITLAQLFGSVWLYKNKSIIENTVNALLSVASTASNVGKGIDTAKNILGGLLGLFGSDDDEPVDDKTPSGIEANAKMVGEVLKHVTPVKLILAVNFLALSISSGCLDVYMLGKYIDGDFSKSNANQEKKSSKETVSDKNKISKPEDKSQNSHENSKKSKI